MGIKLELPDLEEMFKIVEDIHTLVVEKSQLDIEIKLEESNITRIVSSDSTYHIGGKPPSQTYIDNTYKYSGLNGELVEKRQRFATVVAEIERQKSRLDLYKQIVEIWRTQEASERKATL